MGHDLSHVMNGNAACADISRYNVNIYDPVTRRAYRQAQVFLQRVIPPTEITGGTETFMGRNDNALTLHWRLGAKAVSVRFLGNGQYEATVDSPKETELFFGRSGKKIIERTGLLANTRLHKMAIMPQVSVGDMPMELAVL